MCTFILVIIGMPPHPPLLCTYHFFFKPFLRRLTYMCSKYDSNPPKPMLYRSYHIHDECIDTSGIIWCNSSFEVFISTWKFSSSIFHDWKMKVGIIWCNNFLKQLFKLEHFRVVFHDWKMIITLIGMIAYVCRMDISSQYCKASWFGC